MTHSTIHTNVMRRVHTIHAVRPFLSGTALASALLLLAIWGIGREVWVAHVVQNLEEVARSGSVLNFLVAAFMNTRFIVQVLTLVAASALVYTFAEFIRALTPARRYA
jgi:hypothetical protein